MNKFLEIENNQDSLMKKQRLCILDYDQKKKKIAKIVKIS